MRKIWLVLLVLALCLAPGFSPAEEAAADVTGIWTVSAYAPQAYEGVAEFRGSSRMTYLEIRADGTMAQVNPSTGHVKESAWTLQDGRLMSGGSVFAVLEGDTLVRNISLAGTPYAVVSYTRGPVSYVFPAVITPEDASAFDGRWELVLYGVDYAVTEPEAVALSCTAEMNGGVYVHRAVRGGKVLSETIDFGTVLKNGRLTAPIGSGVYTAALCLLEDGSLMLNVGSGDAVWIFRRAE